MPLSRAGGDIREVDGRWESAYGVNESGVILVRSDGFIAWRERGQAAHPESVLDNVLYRLSFKDVIPATKDAPAA
jgi:putative polyketide hydroxylase